MTRYRECGANIHKKKFVRGRMDDKNSYQYLEKTYDEHDDQHRVLTPGFFVDFLYPLRLVCQQFNNILRAKVVNEKHDNSYIIILA
jgi:hypothetical protein